LGVFVEIKVVLFWWKKWIFGVKDCIFLLELVSLFVRKLVLVDESTLLRMNRF